MHRTIDFPNLGIHLKSVGDHITVFGFDIAYYGIVIGIGILAGLMLAVMEAKRTHQNVEDYYDLAIYGVIFSIIGARAYYVIFSWDMYKDDIKSIINIREGGLAIYGGVITAIIVVFIFAKIKKISPFLLFDTGGFGLITGQMIGRWGNFFNREAFGEYTNGLFAMRLPVDAVRSSDITTKMWNHADHYAAIPQTQEIRWRGLPDLSLRLRSWQILDRKPQNRSAFIAESWTSGITTSGRHNCDSISNPDYYRQKKSRTHQKYGIKSVRQI